VLAKIYGWFTEGFDTKDLQEAKTLLGNHKSFDRSGYDRAVRLLRCARNDERAVVARSGATKQSLPVKISVVIYDPADVGALV